MKLYHLDEISNTVAEEMARAEQESARQDNPSMEKLVSVNDKLVVALVDKGATKIHNDVNITRKEDNRKLTNLRNFKTEGDLERVGKCHLSSSVYQNFLNKGGSESKCR